MLFVIRELAGGGAERALSNITMNFPKDWEIDLLMNNRDFIDFPYRGKSSFVGHSRATKQEISCSSIVGDHKADMVYEAVEAE